MPFDFDEYEVKLKAMTVEQLAREKHKYTREYSSGVAGQTAGFFTAPIGLLGVPFSALAWINAVKKMELIDAELGSRSEAARFRVRDFVLGAATAGAGAGIGHVAGLGAVSVLSDGLGQAALTTTEKAVTAVVTGVAEKGSEHLGNEGVRHIRGKFCDHCNEWIFDSYYHCTSCEDYDYCLKCHKEFGAGDHDFKYVA